MSASPPEARLDYILDARLACYHHLSISDASPLAQLRSLITAFRWDLCCHRELGGGMLSSSILGRSSTLISTFDRLEIRKLKEKSRKGNAIPPLPGININIQRIVSSVLGCHQKHCLGAFVSKATHRVNTCTTLLSFLFFIQVTDLFVWIWDYLSSHQEDMSTFNLWWWLGIKPVSIVKLGLGVYTL